MSRPRQVIAGATVLVSRRCFQRLFLLVPSETVNAIVAYVLAVAARSYVRPCQSGRGRPRRLGPRVAGALVRAGDGDRPNAADRYDGAMKLYFRHKAESELGTGTAYIEITDGWPSRQVEVYGNAWLWGDDAHDEHLADQPLEVLELGDEHVITATEFEHAWEEARRRAPLDRPPR